MLLNADKFMPEFHLRQPRFTYSACRPFTKHCERIQIFKEADNLKRINENELDKACFALDATYSESKSFSERTVSDKMLRGRAYEIAISPKYDRYKKGVASMM